MQQDIIWAPWRLKYIQEISNSGGCFICDYLRTPDKDEENFVLWRTDKSVVIFNRFPYNNGHLLIAPVRHIPDLDSADDSELLELTKIIRETQKALTAAIKPHGFNIGMNFGRCAGAGLPEHMHIHVVPRWEGDTNFMSTCSDAKVISQSLEELYKLLKKVSEENNLPGL
ncbi:MAG: HIT domain-containing protein [Phycisphaerae bacterium]